MIKTLFFLFFCVPLAAASLDPSPPWEELDQLILSTEKQLHKEKKLKEHLEGYWKWHEVYLQNIDDRELAYKCGEYAYKALEIIGHERLAPYFDPAFISELTLFAKLKSKPSIPKIVP
jgi:hypothetical protein